MLSGLFVFPANPPDLPALPDLYRNVNVSSIVMRTGTGSPSLVPGAKRHAFAATTAC